METLKISDLSVGDWVSIEDIYCKVEYILSDGIIGTTCRNYRDGYEDPLTNLRPIPITAEMLEKNGFFSDRLAGWYKCKLDDILRTRIEVHIGAVGVDRIEISSVDAFDEDWSTLDVMINKRIKGVHQLQHALRLAGVDTEINL